MTIDRGMGLPLQATLDDFTRQEVAKLTELFNAPNYKGENIRWRDASWRVVSQKPLLLEEIQNSE